MNENTEPPTSLCPALWSAWETLGRPEYQMELIAFREDRGVFVIWFLGEEDGWVHMDGDPVDPLPTHYTHLPQPPWSSTDF